MTGERKNLIPEITIMCIVLILFISFFTWYGVTNHRIKNDVVNICNELGYNISSTRSVDWSPNPYDTISIECNGNIHPTDLNIKKVCVRRDKYDNCNKRRLTLKQNIYR